MTPLCITTYLPAWVDAKGTPVLGPDEDAVTLAVSAALPAVEHARAAGVAVSRVVLVTRQPAYIEGNTTRVLHRALALDASCAVEEQLGGGPAVLTTLASATPGTVVIAVDVEPAAAAAVLVGDGDALSFTARLDIGLPMTVRPAGSATSRQYEDPRLLREEGWRPVLTALGGDGPIAITGVPAKEARSIAGRTTVSVTGPLTGTAAPVFALASLFAEPGDDTRLVAVEQGSGIAVEVHRSATTTVLRLSRAPLPAPARGFAPRVPGDIPMALPAYARAFDSKVGFVGRRCQCGQLQFPPRTQCLECGRIDETMPYALARQAIVHSVVTVHPPVPGLYGPYSIVVAEIEDGALRVLARVTDVDAGTVAIGDDGALVLRRIAVREGIPDYDYAFQPGAFQPQLDGVSA